MTTRTIRWGVLGTGLIAHKQTADLVGNGFSVAAVGSRSADTAESFARAYDIPRAHASYAALLQDDMVDVVYIATPPVQHFDTARAALESGKHVLLEKPFTVNARQARLLAAIALENRVVLMEAMWTRFLPHMVRIREIVRAGTLGEIRLVTADDGQRLPQDPGFRLNQRAAAGGSILDLGVYPVNFAHSILGVPARIQATGIVSEEGVDRHTAVLLSFENGAAALGHSAIDATGPNRAAVVGTHGRIEIEPVWYASTSFRVWDAGGSVVEEFEKTLKPRGMQYQAWEMERLIQEGRLESDVMPLRETVEVMETLDSVRRIVGVRFDADEQADPSTTDI